MENNRIEEIISFSIEKIKKMVDTSTIIGEAIVIDGKKIIPVSKITLGLVAGGGEYNGKDKQVAKTKNLPLAGGTGSGISVVPIAFLCIDKDKVNLIKVDNFAPLEKLFEIMPKVAEQIAKIVKEK